MLAFYRLPDAAQSVSGASGEALPEWARVRAARPGFAGHEQPQVPGELGYCDVRDGHVRDMQATLARSHALTGFCYVFRTPGATAELNPVLADIVATGQPDFPFCVCWETTSLHAGAGFGAGDEQRERLFNPEECAALIAQSGASFPRSPLPAHRRAAPVCCFVPGSDHSGTGRRVALARRMRAPGCRQPVYRLLWWRVWGRSPATRL